MDFEKTLENILKPIRKKNISILSSETKYKLSKLEEHYNDYKSTKDEMYLKKYINLLRENPNLPNKKQLYLREISNDKTVLDVIVEKNLIISYDTGTFLASDIDLIDIYLKHNDTTVLIYAKEEILLSNYKDTTLVEYLIKNNLINSYWIEEITNRKLINLLIKYNKSEYLKYASSEILLMELNNKKTVLEYLIENDLAVEETIRKINNKIVFDLLVKYNRDDLMQYLSNDVLAISKFGKTILEKVLDRGVKPKLKTIYSETLVKAIIRKEEYSLLEKTCQTLLKMKIPKTKVTIFEYLLRKNIICKEAIESIKYSSDANFFIPIIIKCNRLDILKEVEEKTLLEKTHNEITLLELLIKNNIAPSITCYENKKSLEILSKYNRYDLLQKCSFSLLKNKLENGKYLYEELFDRGYDIFSDYITDEEILRYIIRNKKVNLYSKITVPFQLKIYKDNITYLEQILIDERTDKNIDLTNIITFTLDLYQKAQLYQIYAKYDKQSYLPILDEDDLLEEIDNKKFIDILLNMNSELTVNKILEKRVKEEYEIALILKLRGEKQDNIKFESITTKLEREYLTNLRFEYEALSLDNENEELLGELYNIMDDKKSDPYLVYALIATYRNLLSINSKYAKEIYQLIEIKRNNPEFVLKYVKDGAYFNTTKKYIGMEDANIDTLNHEVGHALHNFLAEDKMPVKFRVLIDKLRNDKTLIEKTSILSEQYLELRKMVEEEVEANYMKKYDESIDEEKLQEIQGFLDEEITIKKIKYLKLGYSEELLDIIFNKIYTVDEYIRQDRRVKKNNMVDLILRTRYAALISTADYLDAIYGGKFKSGELYDKNNQQIKPTYGHGIGYYRRGYPWSFSEMIANYSEIVKSKNPTEGIEILKKYVGEELVEFIQEYYDKQILNSKKYITEEQKIM